MTTLARLRRPVDAPATLPARSEWMPTESELRTRREMEDTLNRAAKRGDRRRFTGERLTQFGDLT